MLPSKFEANPKLRLRVKRSSLSLFLLASSCSNAHFCAYVRIDFLADWLVFLTKYGHIYIILMDTSLDHINPCPRMRVRVIIGETMSSVVLQLFPQPCVGTVLLRQDSNHSCFLRTFDSVPGFFIIYYLTIIYYLFIIYFSVPCCIRSRLVPCTPHHSLVSSFNRSDAHNERDSVEGCGPVREGCGSAKER